MVKVEVVASGIVFTDTTGSDGCFLIEGVPLGEDILFSAGGLAGKGDVSNFPYTTPEEIVNPDDSVNNNFSVVLPDDVPTTTWYHIRGQNVHGTGQDTIWYNVTEGGFTLVQENNIRNHFANLQIEENEVFIYVEKPNASDTGINISNGTYNTSPTVKTIVTPLGNSLYPVVYANTTMPGGGFQYHNSFVHEIKRALGFDEVSWSYSSVMDALATVYILEDKDISREVSRAYWIAVYQDEKTNIPIDYLYDTMDGNRE